MIGPLAVPFLWAVVSRRTSATAVWWAVLLGIACSLGVQFLLPMWDLEVTLANKLMASIAAPFIVLLIGRTKMQPNAEKQREINAFFDRMKAPPMTDATRVTTVQGPVTAVGMLIVGFGILMLQLLWLIKEQRLLISLFCFGFIVFGISVWLTNRPK